MTGRATGMLRHGHQRGEWDTAAGERSGEPACVEMNAYQDLSTPENLFKNCS